MTRRFGPIFARTFGSALVHGIYAADSRQLSVRAAFPSLWAMEDRGWGSVVRGALLPDTASPRVDYDVGDIPNMMKNVSVYSFADGISTLTGALATRLQNQPNVEILCDTPISSLGVAENGLLEVILLFSEKAVILMLLDRSTWLVDRRSTPHISYPLCRFLCSITSCPQHHHFLILRRIPHPRSLSSTSYFHKHSLSYTLPDSDISSLAHRQGTHSTTPASLELSLTRVLFQRRIQMQAISRK